MVVCTVEVRTSSKLLASLMRNNFPKRPSYAPLQNLSKLYDATFGFVASSSPFHP